MLTLDQNQSNLLYWTKGWYENHDHKNFWPQLKILYKDYTHGDGDIFDLQWYVRELWRKLIKANGNEDFLIERYEEETLPIKARYYRGAPNHNDNQNWQQSFSSEEIVEARIAVMASQIAFIHANKFKSLFPTDLDGLTISEENKQKLQQMFDNKEK